MAHDIHNGFRSSLPLLAATAAMGTGGRPSISG